MLKLVRADRQLLDKTLSRDPPRGGREAWVPNQRPQDRPRQAVRVFEVKGGLIGVSDGWRDGPTFDKGSKWAPDEIGAKVMELIGEAPAPQKVHGT